MKEEFTGSFNFLSECITYSISGQGNRIVPFCLCVCLGLWKLQCAPLRWWRAMLCTIDLHCALPACAVHQVHPIFLEVIFPHMVHNTGRRCTMKVDGEQHSSVPLKWCTTYVPRKQTNGQTDATTHIISPALGSIMKWNYNWWEEIMVVLWVDRAPETRCVKFVGRW